LDDSLAQAGRMAKRLLTDSTCGDRCDTCKVGIALTCDRTTNEFNETKGMAETRARKWPTQLPWEGRVRFILPESIRDVWALVSRSGAAEEFRYSHGQCANRPDVGPARREPAPRRRTTVRKLFSQWRGGAGLYFRWRWRTHALGRCKIKGPVR